MLDSGDALVTDPLGAGRKWVPPMLLHTPYYILEINLKNSASGKFYHTLWEHRISLYVILYLSKYMLYEDAELALANTPAHTQHQYILYIYNFYCILNYTIWMK